MGIYLESYMYWITQVDYDILFIENEEILSL